MQQPVGYNSVRKRSLLTSSTILVLARTSTNSFVMFGRVTFYPTLVYNIALEKLSVRKWYSRIDETVVLGALPWRTIAPQVTLHNGMPDAFSLTSVSTSLVLHQTQLIEEENVRGVVSMNEDFELRHWVPSAEEWGASGVKFLQLETADIFHAPTPEKLKRGIAFIQQFEGTGNSVYVHCKAGRTRSATLVACYLMQKHDWDAKTAVQFMKSKRSHILLHTVQWDALRAFSSSRPDQNPVSLT